MGNSVGVDGSTRRLRAAWKAVERASRGDETPDLPVETRDECRLWYSVFPCPPREFTLKGRMVEQRWDRNKPDETPEEPAPEFLVKRL